jgi:hypothetical protein
VVPVRKPTHRLFPAVFITQIRIFLSNLRITSRYLNLLLHAPQVSLASISWYFEAD